MTIRELLQNTDDIDPESVIVHFVEFNASSLMCGLSARSCFPIGGSLPRCRKASFSRSWALLNDLGIDFAFPSRSVYIESLPENEDDRDRMLRAMRAQARANPRAMKRPSRIPVRLHQMQDPPRHDSGRRTCRPPWASPQPTWKRTDRASSVVRRLSI